MEEDEDEADVREDCELERWALLRGPGMNILVMSSWVIADVPLVHVALERAGGWNVTGGATAVICGFQTKGRGRLATF